LLHKRIILLLSFLLFVEVIVFDIGIHGFGLHQLVVLLRAVTRNCLPSGAGQKWAYGKPNFPADTSAWHRLDTKTLNSPMEKVSLPPFREKTANTLGLFYENRRSTFLKN